MKLTPTPAQTVGPFFGFALPYEGGSELVDQARPGSIRLHGTVYDGDGAPIPDAMIEIWQADEDGTIPGPPALWCATATPSPASDAPPSTARATTPSPQ